MPDSDTRSCGRIGPAMQGSTVVMSSDSVSVKTGSALLAVRNRPCALAYFSTSATRAGLRAVFFRKRTVSASTGKKPQVAPYSGAMLARVARSSSDNLVEAGAVIFHEFAHHALLAQHLRDGQHQIGGGDAFAQFAGELEADHFGNQHRDGLAQHRRFRLDAAHAPAQHRQAVDHGGVAVGADHRIGEGEFDGLFLPSFCLRTQTVSARYSRLTWWQMPVPGGTTRKFAKACWPQRRN